MKNSHKVLSFTDRHYERVAHLINEMEAEAKEFISAKEEMLKEPASSVTLDEWKKLEKVTTLLNEHLNFLSNEFPKIKALDKDWR
jgi:hypothetical protein